MMTDHHKSKCQFIKPDGTKCNSWALTDGAFCFHHAPETQEAKKKASSKGGSARKGRIIAVDSQTMDVELSEAENVMTIYETIIGDTLKLENSAPRNKAVGSLLLQALKARILIRQNYDSESKPRHSGGMDQMLDRLSGGDDVDELVNEFSNSDSI